MSAPIEARVWASLQPMQVLEGYLFRVTEYGIDLAGDWLTEKWKASQ